jgi:CRP/FNR family transcriptional regulator, nitrogen fixation regulation protein
MKFFSWGISFERGAVRSANRITPMRPRPHSRSGIVSVQLPSLDPSIQRLGFVRSYRPKTEIIAEDTPADRVYQVVTGTVCTCKMLKQGRRQIAGFYFAGDLFGLEATTNNILAAHAITDARVRSVKKQALSALAASDVEVSDRLLSLTARELARKQDLALLLSRGSQERVIYFLVEMAQRTSPKESRIELPMSRQDIGDYLGLTIETVSRVFWDLERRGVIKIAGRRAVVIRNQAAKLGAERVLSIFDAVKGRQPKTERELEEWLASAEGKAATLFNLTTISRWGEIARS